MALNSSGVSMGSWVQFSPDVAMRFETDAFNEEVMLCFGSQDEYVLILTKDALNRVVDLAMQALSDLDGEVGC